jgi:hypothetical protein
MEERAGPSGTSSIPRERGGGETVATERCRRSVAREALPETVATGTMPGERCRRPLPEERAKGTLPTHTASRKG